MSLRIEQAPATEPVTVDEVAAELRMLDISDNDRTLIGGHIIAAREMAEKVTRKSLVYKGYVAYFDRFPYPGDPIMLPAPPLVSVTSVLYLDSAMDQQTWDSAEYYVFTKQDPGLIVPKPSIVYPAPVRLPGAVEVHFKAGYAVGGYGDEMLPITENLRLGIKKLAAHYYDHPEAVSAEVQNAVPQAFMDIFRANRFYPIPERR